MVKSNTGGSLCSHARGLAPMASAGKWQERRQVDEWAPSKRAN